MLYYFDIEERTRWTIWFVYEIIKEIKGVLILKFKNQYIKDVVLWTYILKNSYILH